MHSLLKTEYLGYIQDCWKLRPELTVNIGFRYEFFNAFHEEAEFVGVQGKQDVHALARRITIRLGSRSLVEAGPMTFDNSEMSARYGTEIAGALFPRLSDRPR